MHIYDTLIIGSGYSSQGYALTRGNCIICEENQCCDTHFYLPLSSFLCDSYTPVTEKGKRLSQIFDKYNIIKNGYMYTNALECAFCEFLSREKMQTLLKCRVVKAEKQHDDLFKVTVYTNEGLSSLYAKNVYDTTEKIPMCESYLTVIYMTKDGEKTQKELSSVFNGSIFTPAFCENRYAMHVPARKIIDVNEMLCFINDLWLSANTDGKILYTAPVFHGRYSEKTQATDNFPKDYSFSNPLQAFEEGIFFAGGDR